jgi:hypothetical protein
VSPKNVPQPERPSGATAREESAGAMKAAMRTARIRKAFDDELAVHGLTFDSPRELWPKNIVVRVSRRMKREAPRPS